MNIKIFKISTFEKNKILSFYLLSGIHRKSQFTHKRS